MMSLMLKFIKPNSGEIYLDDKNLNLIKTKDLRTNIAFVQQQPFCSQGLYLRLLRWVEILVMKKFLSQRK